MASSATPGFHFGSVCSKFLFCAASSSRVTLVWLMKPAFPGLAFEFPFHYDASFVAHVRCMKLGTLFHCSSWHHGCQQSGNPPAFILCDRLRVSLHQGRLRDALHVGQNYVVPASPGQSSVLRGAKGAPRCSKVRQRRLPQRTVMSTALPGIPFPESRRVGRNVRPSRRGCTALYFPRHK